MPKDLSFTGDFHESNRFELSRFESRACTGRYVEPHAARLVTLEFECGVHLKKMKVTPYLDRTIATISHLQLYCSSSIIDEDGFWLQKVLPWNHARIGS
jgi:hypothetical protein